MKNIVISVALGASAIFASSAADAAPVTKGLAMLPDNSIENVRLVCDEFGRCYRTRGGRRVIYGNSYGYAPGYYGGPRYYGGGYGPGVSVGIGPGGGGVGGGPRWESGKSPLFEGPSLGRLVRGISARVFILA